ncbi:class I glutamine amidotransferase-like protein [Echria macrotheca]|uniref:Class I glutamine amidotransferase-like protein n=1 Tax=Echria macrotheca TaxID=438768 RepID=A0AAJ0F3W2_9PEZI|nr:class I glutamine amidotransferase-like protein [Echria macrotheca]
MAPRKILLVLFPGFNTLDMNGPYEVLQKAGDGAVFEIFVAAESEITTSIEGVHVKRDIALDDDLIRNHLPQYEMLVVPGGTTDPVVAQAAKVNSPFMRLIEAYAALPEPPHSVDLAHDGRILLSICTGAIFLGALGIFDTKLCTTHWAAYDLLKKYAQTAAARTLPPQQAGTVVAARFVDSGVSPATGLRVISSGGISCGMDASLYVVKLRVGEAAAQTVAGLLDYAWRKTEGFVVLDQAVADKGEKKA